MATRIPWDKYEAALLLEYCIKVENKEISRTEAISTVSMILRDRASRNGHEIDDVFRNENGIGMQMSSIRNCYLGKEHGLTISKLFREIVSLQKNDPETFQKILKEESGNMDTSAWTEFLQWLENNYPERKEETLHATLLVNTIGKKNGILKKKLSVINDSEEIENLMKSFRTLRFLDFNPGKIQEVYRTLQLYAEFLHNKESSIKNVTESEKQTSDGVNRDGDYFTVDFNVTQSYAHTKPVFCSYKGHPIKKSGWNAIFLSLVQAIYWDYKDVFPVGQSLSSSTRVDTGSSQGMIYPKEIEDGVYLECNVNSTGVVSKLRSLMDICGVDYGDIEIQYRATGSDCEGKTSTGRSVIPNWIPRYTDSITRILAAKYKYGFRIGSPIEMMKIRNYAEIMKLELPESDEDLEKEINTVGVTIDGKVYVFSDELLLELGNIIDVIFQKGVGVIFLSAFIERHMEWLEDNHISSEALLKEVIRRCRPNLYFGQNIITQGKRMTEYEATVSEIHRVADCDSVVRTADISEKLIYIPYEKISWSLSASDEFVWISEGKYFCMNHFVHSAEDTAAILNYASVECASKGYASITDFPMGSIPEDNFELSITGLYSAVYTAILKEKYFMNGKIITTDPNGIDISTLLEAYCLNRDECTVVEMMERAEELTGYCNKQYSLIALYDKMVRADADRFVSEKQVSFDVEKIDDLLNDIIGERFAPIRKVSTFALFPICGLTWNHHVLESYCYRYSKKYRLSVLNYNDKNAGIIAATELPLTYNEMLSEAAAKADIELTLEAVGEYLFINGFTAKRKYSCMPEIIEKAKNIREEE